MLDQRTAPYAALLLRVSLGLLFIAHLYWKFELIPGGVHSWWSHLTASGYHWIVPWYVISAEFAGALLLIPGIGTRWVCIYTLPLMIGAAQFWLARKGFYFTAAGGELPIVWGGMLVIQALLGDGPYAVKLPVAATTKSSQTLVSDHGNLRSVARGSGGEGPKSLMSKFRALI